MFKFPLLRPRTIGRAAAVIAGCWVMAPPAMAQQHAHTHGRVVLDVAVDAQSITLAIASPLDGFLGFERAPRTDAERQRVEDMVARLNAADRLFQPDPAGECRLSKVALASPVLGLGAGAKRAEAAGHDHDDNHDERHGHGDDHADDTHADIDVDIVFACARAAEARFIDVRLFDTFKRIRVVEAQVASPEGQFKRTLRPGSQRLALTR